MVCPKNGTAVLKGWRRRNIHTPFLTLMDSVVVVLLTLTLKSWSPWSHEGVGALEISEDYQKTKNGWV